MKIDSTIWRITYQGSLFNTIIREFTIYERAEQWARQVGLLVCNWKQRDFTIEKIQQ